MRVPGRKTSKSYRQPVSHVRDRAVLLTPGGGNWKLNLADGRPERIRLGRRSVLMRMTPEGRRLGTARISNSPAQLRKEIAKAGRCPEVVVEAALGWYCAVDAPSRGSASTPAAQSDRGPNLMRVRCGVLSA
jgi:hypothetical protein